MRTALLAILLLSGTCLGSAGGAVAPMHARETPIVAELLSQPEHFIGRSIAIYGLVVDVLDGGRRFMLQDVSQMPFPVVAPKGEHILRGNQLMVHGVVRRVNGRLEVAAGKVFFVRVVAGGGCC